MIEIYGKNGCGFCVRAKQLCESKGIDYEYYNISEDPSLLDCLVERLGEKPKTVPQIFESGKYYPGGYEEFQKRIFGRSE